MNIMMLNHDDLNADPVYFERTNLFKPGDKIEVNGATVYVVDCAQQDKGEPAREFVGSYTTKTI